MMRKCPECDGMRGVKIERYKDHTHVRLLRGAVYYWAESYRCLTCRELFDTVETTDRNLASARVAIERQK